MKLDPNILRRCHELLSQGATMEELIAMLRESGCMKMESIKMMRTVTGMSLREAKAAVHLSETWADVRESHDRIHDQLCDALIELGEEEGAEVDIEMDEETGEERVSVTFDLTRPNDEGEKET